MKTYLDIDFSDNPEYLEPFMELNEYLLGINSMNALGWGNFPGDKEFFVTASVRQIEHLYPGEFNFVLLVDNIFKSRINFLSLRSEGILNRLEIMHIYQMSSKIQRLSELNLLAANKNYYCNFNLLQNSDLKYLIFIVGDNVDENTKNLQNLYGPDKLKTFKIFL